MGTVAVEEFPYALTDADLPVGYSLVSTDDENRYSIQQTWKTPTDSVGSHFVHAYDFNTSIFASSIMESIQDQSIFYEEINIAGADKAYNFSNPSIPVGIAARKGQFYVQIFIINESITVWTEFVAMTEGQLTKFPSSTTNSYTYTPMGFEGILTLGSILITGMIVLRRRS